jgi:streptogramin lyase
MNVLRLTRYLSVLLLTLLPFTVSPTTFAHTVPEQAGTITEYPLPNGSEPWGITRGPDGNLWFTDQVGQKIGKITTQGTITEYPVSACCPLSITTGPNGHLWFTVTYDNQDVDTSYIGKSTLQGKTSLYPLFSQDYRHPYGITLGPDGNVWFTVYWSEGLEDWGDYVGRITPQGKVTLIPVGSFAHPYYITTGPDGNLWFTESGDSMQHIVQLNPYTLKMTDYGFYGTPIDITTGPDGNMWFTDFFAGNIVEFSISTRQFIRYTIPTPNSEPWGITAGSDGNLWFTEYGGNKIGRISPKATTINSMITEFPIPTSTSYPTEITSGPDGNLWFTESAAGKIGKITTGDTGCLCRQY